MQKPVYKTQLISTIVDSISLAHPRRVYKTQLISTIVDSELFFVKHF